MTVPLFLADALAGLLGGLGMGGQVTIALVVGFAAWYAVKGLRVGKAAGSMVASAVAYGAFTAAFLAVALFFGWFEANPGIIAEHVSAAVGFVWSLVTQFGDDILRAVGVVG